MAETHHAAIIRGSRAAWLHQGPHPSHAAALFALVERQGEVIRGWHFRLTGRICGSEASVPDGGIGNLRRHAAAIFTLR
jgi:hypothetical protein